MFAQAEAKHQTINLCVSNHQLYIVLHTCYIFINYIYTSVHNGVMFVLIIYPEFWHQWHLCLVRCIPRAFGWKIIHRDQGVSWESCSAVVQGKHSRKLSSSLQRKSCRVHFLQYASFHNTCHACVCILESPGIRGEGFSDVPQILGRVQQRSWLHGLLVQVTLLPFMSIYSTCYSSIAYDIFLCLFFPSTF